MSVLQIGLQIIIVNIIFVKKIIIKYFLIFSSSMYVLIKRVDIL